MKFQIYNWACEPSVYDKLGEMGYEFDGRDLVMEGDIHEEAKKIFEAGLNVMLWNRPHDGEMPVLFVDTRRFQQR